MLNKTEKFHVLAVLSDQENLHLFKRIQEHPKFIAKEKEGEVEVMTTIYEDFINGKKHDSYDAVALVFMKDFNKLDL